MGLHSTHTRGLVRMAFCILFIAILEDPAASSSDKVSYEVCKPSHCGGNRLNISYPFYIPGEGRELCGYPGFEITCEGTNIMYGLFSVENISYKENSIELASQMLTSCFAPRPFSFLPINTFLKNSVSLHPNLWFFYNCPNSSSFPFLTSPVSCPSNATSNTYVALLPNGTFSHQNGSFLVNGTFYHQIGSFQFLSVVPVELKGGFSHQTIKDVNYTELLEDGVWLKWDLLASKSCTGCQDSGGRCGRSLEADFLCYCPCGTNRLRDCNGDGGIPKAWSLRKKGALGASICAFIVAIIVLAYLRQRKISQQTKLVVTGSRMMKKSHKCEAIFENRGILVTRRYSYADIKRMTKSFKNKLGQGGYGCVYKGKLPNGRLVAVKILSKLKGDGEDFINEVNSMSRTSHVNIVNLLGFCLHKTKRALVYEYMPNGSLEKLIYKENYNKLGCGHLGWDILYQISLGIAQGLEYLHQGCNSRILHFDVKPHNILLDENYYPKISDFGLAKICHQEESTISLLGVRGTAGFIAPEVFCRNIGGISQKSDVYSFGMTVLEMVGGENAKCLV